MQKHISIQRLIEIVWLSTKLSAVVLFVMFLCFMISCQKTNQPVREDLDINDAGTTDSSLSGRLPSMTTTGIVPIFGASS